MSSVNPVEAQAAPRAEHPLKDAILKAAKADDIPAGTRGCWTVRKFSVARPAIVPREEGGLVMLPPGNYTHLFCYTSATAMKNGGLGDCVMHDTPEELAKHLQFMLAATGRVLVTGLGLGCVTRGLLANPNVHSVTVIEREASVLRLVMPWMPKDERLSVVHADALEWVRRTRRQFDCAWHDLWTDEGAGEPHLQIVHMQLICALAVRRAVKLQGAWAFPRYFRRTMKEANVL